MTDTPCGCQNTQCSHQKEQDFMVVDQKDFDQTQIKSTQFQELVHEAEGFSQEEKNELLKHINDITQQNIGIK
jgi:hypothetical protein